MASSEGAELTGPTLEATVVILTFNGEQYLDHILDAVEDQDFDGDFEVLVIDSGSTDRTLEIVASHPNVRLHQIPNSEFGHGKTRNLAAQLANGRIVAYLTHDAIPRGRRWLHEICAPLREDFGGVVAVMGKQTPRRWCFPLLKYEIQAVFTGFGPEFGTTVFFNDGFADTPGLINALGFYSDVNSATFRDFLLNRIPYRDVRYSEDMLFGRDIIEAGLKKAYAPRADVEHSNDLTLGEYRRRIFDETIGLRQIGTDIPTISRLRQVAVTAKGIIGDSIRIVRDTQYSPLRKAYWLVVNPAFHLAKWQSFRHATTVALDDHDAIASGSLEHSRKRHLTT